MEALLPPEGLVYGSTSTSTSSSSSTRGSPSKPAAPPLPMSSALAAAAAPWEKDDGSDALGKPPGSSACSHVTCAQLGWALLAVAAVTGYLTLALNGGAVALVLRLNRWGGARDIYANAAAHGRVYALHPFEEMFMPLHVSKHGPRRSLAVFTAGADGLENVDRLVRAWGSESFDYMICHFDESQAEWAALPWYKQAVGFYAHRQAKMFYFKRALSPHLVQEYEYGTCDARGLILTQVIALACCSLSHNHTQQQSPPSPPPIQRSALHRLGRGLAPRRRRRRRAERGALPSLVV